jgi:STE24 endopeptidase
MRVAAGIATLAVLAAAWLYAASLLWRTQVPANLRLPRLDPHRVFSEALLRRAARHDGFLRIDFLLASAAQLVALVWLAVRPPRGWGGPLLRGLELALLALVVSWLARFPFGLAAEWWERRYGISRQSYGAWLVGRLPSPGSVAALLVLVALGMWLARRLGRRWWLAAGPLLAVGGLVLTLVQPLLGPTLHPLRDRQLAAVLAGSGIRLGVDKVADETREANAEAIGIGPTRRIVFTDTILRRPFGAPELRFVARHELAHHRRHHLWKGAAWFALFALPCAFVLAAAAEWRGGLARPEAVPAVLLAAFCIQLVSLPVGGAIARRYEAEADWTALRATHEPAAARRLFVDFARVDLEQPDPPHWSQLLLDDHPSLLQRIEMAEAWTNRRQTARGSPEGSGSPPGSPSATTPPVPPPGDPGRAAETRSRATR